jgi:tetratricopeptide (TPR) repeat protein
VFNSTSDAEHLDPIASQLATRLGELLEKRGGNEDQRAAAELYGKLLSRPNSPTRRRKLLLKRSEFWIACGELDRALVDLRTAVTESSKRNVAVLERYSHALELSPEPGHKRLAIGTTLQTLRLKGSEKFLVTLLDRLMRLLTSRGRAGDLDLFIRTIKSSPIWSARSPAVLRLLLQALQHRNGPGDLEDAADLVLELGVSMVEEPEAYDELVAALATQLRRRKKLENAHKIAAFLGEATQRFDDPLYKSQAELGTVLSDLFRRSGNLDYLDAAITALELASTDPQLASASEKQLIQLRQVLTAVSKSDPDSSEFVRRKKKSHS